MAYAGAGEELPLLRIDRVLVADRERDQNARIRTLGQGVADFFPRRRAQPLEPVPGHPGRHTLGDDLSALIRCAARRHSHVAGRANAALEQPGLVIEPVRVGAAVRPAQPHRETPALPGPHRKHAPGIVRRESAVGGEHDASRHPGLRRLDVEIEAHAALEGLRQAGDDTDDDDIAPLERRIQPVGKPQVREGRGPGETEGGKADERCAGSDDGRNAPGETDRGDRGKGKTRREPHRPRQHRLLLEQAHAEREAQCGKSHREPAAPFIPRITAKGRGG